MIFRIWKTIYMIIIYTNILVLVFIDEIHILEFNYILIILEHLLNFLIFCDCLIYSMKEGFLIGKKSFCKNIFNIFNLIATIIW